MMNLFYTIPEITEPLGRYWEQPDKKNILIDDEYAAMTDRTFKQLAEYSITLPTGVYEGKMWKAKYKDGKWRLLWYDVSEKPGDCSIKNRLIIIV